VQHPVEDRTFVLFLILQIQFIRTLRNLQALAAFPKLPTLRTHNFSVNCIETQRPWRRRQTGQRPIGDAFYAAAESVYCSRDAQFPDVSEAISFTSKRLGAATLAAVAIGNSFLSCLRHVVS